MHLQRDGEEIATVRIEFLFSSAGEYWHRCGSSSPFRALLAKSVVGPIYDDKGDGEGEEGGGGKEGKNATRWKGPTVRRTETNSRVEARHVEGEGEELVAGLYRVSR